MAWPNHECGRHGGCIMAVPVAASVLLHCGPSWGHVHMSTCPLAGMAPPALTCWAASQCRPAPCPAHRQTPTAPLHHCTSAPNHQAPLLSRTCSHQSNPPGTPAPPSAPSRCTPSVPHPPPPLSAPLRPRRPLPLASLASMSLTCPCPSPDPVPHLPLSLTCPSLSLQYWECLTAS